METFYIIGWLICFVVIEYNNNLNKYGKQLALNVLTLSITAGLFIGIVWPIVLFIYLISLATKKALQ
jgi:uncharacterized membrane protein YhdT